MRKTGSSLAALLLGLTASGLLAQAPPSVLIRSQQGQTLQTLSDGSTITFSSEAIGQIVIATVTISYRGSTSVTVNALELSGSADFSLSSNLTPPFTLNPNEAVSFTVQFNPSAPSPRPVTGRLGINYTEGRTTTTVGVNLSGVLSDFGFSYTLPKGNQTSIGAGGTITFPDTLINQISTAQFVVTNRGSGPGTINNITISGAGFNLGSVPLLPAVLPAGQDFKFNINFAPTQLAAASGSVQIEFATRSQSLKLAATGIGAVYAHELAIGSTPARPITPNDTLTLPQTNIGEKSTAVVRIRNTGNADGTITSIRVTGAEFTLTDVPITPLTLKPGEVTSFTITFTPAQPGTVTGRLRIDDTSFNLTGTGLGAALTYTVTVASATTTVANNGSVIFPPTQVGSSAAARVQVSNTGNVPAFINSISLSGAAFTLAELPALPARIGGGESLGFSMAFTPTVVGSATGSLKIDNLTLNLSGAGGDPPALPAVSFPGATATADAVQQISVGVSLASPYPVPLTGKLTLVFASDVFSDDPAIQFAAGGRTLNFVVPAGSTRALFGVDTTQARLQTGTVAGTINLVATFATDPGGINLTPTVAPAATIAIRPAAPRIRSVQLANRTTSGFTLLITGYATSRTVNSMAFQFTQATDPQKTDLKLDTTSLTVPAEGPFSAWYQSTASQTFGSQFTATVTFNVRGDVDAIQSAAVTVSNAQGASNSVSVNLR